MSARSTVVFADLYGSRGVFESFGNAKATELVTQATAWVAQRFGAHGGRVIKFLGDGVLIVFEDSTKAVLAAMDLQHAYQQFLGRMPPKAHMPLRIGVARGDVELMHDDCHGEAVNTAIRLSELTGPHQIWVNSDAAQDGFDLPDKAFRLLELIHIRGLAEPCQVFQVEWQDDLASEPLTVPAGIEPSKTGELEALDGHIKLSWGDQTSTFHGVDLPVHVGRSRQLAFVVPDARVSRTHARFDWRNGSVVLVDLSSFGCWVRFAGSGAPLLLRREECVLHGVGDIALGSSFSDPSAPVVEFVVS